MILARTIEWGGSDLNRQYVVVPRGYEQYSYIPRGERSGMKFTAQLRLYRVIRRTKGICGRGTKRGWTIPDYFTFPGYGRYEDYDSKLKGYSIADLQLVSWILGNFSTVDEAMKAIKKIHIVPIDPRASTVHWRMADITGKQIVLEIVDGQPNFYENTLGVLTNSPGFEWHMTNLNNYINLYSGTTNPRTLGNINFPHLVQAVVSSAFPVMSLPHQDSYVPLLPDFFSTKRNSDRSCYTELSHFEQL